MSRKRFPVVAAIFIGLAAVGVALVIACVLWPSRHLETDRLAVDWQTGGRPMEVSGVVVDDQGRPVTGVDIGVDDCSGGQAATTDSAGRFAMRMGEQEVNALSVGDVGIVKWSEDRLDWGLNCTQGLEFRIRVKAKP